MERIMTALLGLLAFSGMDGRAQDDAGGVAPVIKALQEDERTIRVVASGQFETTFTKQKGFGDVWFDLKHDPQRKHDLAPVLDENGFLWVKTGPPGADGSWYANPSREMKLLESGPTRVRVHLSGSHQRYGKTEPEAAWKGFASSKHTPFIHSARSMWTMRSSPRSQSHSITSCSF